MSRDVSNRCWKPLPPSPITLLSLDEMVARIEAIRREQTESDQCPTCGSMASVLTKRCPTCTRHLSRKCFNRDRVKRGGGLNWECRDCHGARCKAYRTRRARRGQMPLPGVAA